MVDTAVTDHVEHKCAPDCPGCCYCNGGLISCDVCGGAEATLPTECPGHQMSADVLDYVWSGHMDFVNGEWVTKW